MRKKEGRKEDEGKEERKYFVFIMSCQSENKEECSQLSYRRDRTKRLKIHGQEAP